MAEIWAEKYRPRNLNELQNLEEEKIKVYSFIKNYENIKEKAKACIIYGPPGTGKTALAYALANQLKLELIELNASDFRDKAHIKQTVSEAIKQKSLFDKNKLIIIDELEGISGQEDRGGLAELSLIIDSSPYPILLITNDPYNKRFTELRKKYQLIIETKKLSIVDIIKILKRVAKNEKIDVSDETLKLIAANAKGDARAAINDLQTLAERNKKVLLGEVSEYLRFSSRDKEQKIFDALRLLFNSTILTSELFENVDIELEEIIRWIDENLYREYEKEALARAYEMLSLADLYIHRIIRWQYWRFLAYVNIFLCAVGPYANIANKKTKVFVKYSYPSYFIELYRRKVSEEKKLAEELSKSLHCSTSKVRKEMWLLRNFLT
ncbi:MAG: replication factor C large subunit [Candidatus Pacearchaeota archaeon]